MGKKQKKRAQEERIRSRLADLVASAHRTQGMATAPANTDMPVPAPDDAPAPAVRRRGPQKAPTKLAISIRLDRDIVERFRAQGRGWQTRLNAFLREALELDAS